MRGKKMAQLLRLPQVLARVGLRSTRVYQLIGDGLFPKPIKLGARAIAFVESEVDGWIEAQAQKPRAEIRTKSPKKAQTTEAA
jgi:prophage regulatory protein